MSGPLKNFHAIAENNFQQFFFAVFSTRIITKAYIREHKCTINILASACTFEQEKNY